MPIFLARKYRVPSAAGADAKRRNAGDVGAHRRGAPPPQVPRGWAAGGPSSAGTRRARGVLRDPGPLAAQPISALLVVNEVSRHRLRLAP
jgi:hypothetical protein